MAIPIPIIGNIIENIFDYFFMSKEAKIKIKELNEIAKIESDQRKHKLLEVTEQAKIDRISRNDVTESNYDLMAMENARTSIIDEVLVIWVISIVTCLFIPYTQPYAVDGFIALQKYTPIWFQTLVIGAFVSKLGLRFMFNKGITRKPI